MNYSFVGDIPLEHQSPRAELVASGRTLWS
jgi:hypothetical protein